MMARNAPKSASPWANRTLLFVERFCFFVTVVMLALSGVQAYRAIRAHDESDYQRMKQSVLKQEEAISSIRNLLNQSQMIVRDFLLSSGSDRYAALNGQLKALPGLAEATLTRVEQSAAIGKPEMDEIRRRWKVWYELLQEPLSWSETTARERGLHFLTRELALVRRPLQQTFNRLENTDTEQLKDLDENRSTSQRQSVRLLLELASIALFFAIAYGGTVHLKIRNLSREHLRQVEETNRHKADLERLSARLLEIHETERKSLSRELHDGIGQILTALRVEISLAASLVLHSETQQRLHRACRLADEAIQAARNAALLLRPSLLDDLGLEAALCKHVEDFSCRTGVEANIIVEGLRDDLPDAIKTCVYRVAQEALNNCQKHSCARRVDIRLTQVDTGLKLVVTDDGIGFDLNGNNKARGIGLIGMRERAAGVGGSVSVDSPRPGTQVVLSVPFERGSTNPNQA
jgi:signal transduction histidine kinase